MSKLFVYKALDVNGAIVKGEVFADGHSSVSETLKLQNLTLVKAHPHSDIRKKAIPGKDLSSLFLKISLLLEAGQTLYKALITCQESSPQKSLKFLLHHLASQLELGEDFVSVVEQHPKIFTPVLCQYLRLGHKSGNLTDAFKRMHVYLERDLEKQQKIRKMLAYPMLLLVTMTSMVGLFVEYLLPQLIEHLHIIGGKDLPFLTIALITFSQTITNNRLALLTLILMIVLPLVLFPLSSTLQQRLTPLLFKIPWVGYFFKQHFAQKWLLLVGELYEAGVDFKACLQEAESMETNPFIRHQWQSISKGILEGQPLDHMLKKTQLFSPVVIALCEMALHSGTLAQSLIKAHEIEFKDTQHRMEVLIKGLEPGLLVIMALFLLWIVMAVVSPLYDFSF